MGLIRRHRVLTALAVVLLVVVGVGWTLLHTEQPGPASVEDALERFHESDDGADLSPTPRPPDGVYTYRGEGHEQLSVPPLGQDDGETMPATVTHEGRGCWTFRIDFTSGHWQSWRYCPGADRDGFEEVAGATGQQWDLGVSQMGNISHFTCDNNPVVWTAVAGEAVDTRCSGTNSAVDGTTVTHGTWRFVGPEALTIGGEEVEAMHFSGDRQLSGGQEGTEVTEVWFREDGLLLRYERDIEVRTDSPIGDITYTERGWFELADLQPER